MKIYPCARHSHGPVDVVLQLCRANAIDSRDVLRVDVATYGTALKLTHFGNATVLDAQMSMPFAIAAAIVHGRLTLVEFDENCRNDPRVRDIADRISFAKDDLMDSMYPDRRPARVTITTASGKQFSGEVEGPFGEPYRPIPDDLLAEKFMGLCSPVVGEESAATAHQSLVDLTGRAALEKALDQLVVR
jgi:2-methylcitrate dehydratase PrpD